MKVMRFMLDDPPFAGRYGLGVTVAVVDSGIHAAHPHVGDIRQAGFMCGLEIVADRRTKATFPPGERIGYHICLSLRDRGIFLRPLGDVIVLMPPLSSTEDELRHLASSVRTAIVERLGA